MRARKSIAKSKKSPDLNISIPENVLRAAMTHMATKDVRYYLNGVFIEPAADGKSVMVVATDGHRLIASEVQQSDVVPEGLRRSFIVSGESLKGVMRTLSKSGCVFRFTGMDKSSKCMRVAVIEHRTKPRSTEFISWGLVGVVDGRFPDWKSLFGSALNRAPAPVHLNVRYVLDALRANGILMSNLSSRSGAYWELHEEIVVRRGEYETATVHYRDGNTLGLIMPLRPSSGEATTPDWGKVLATAALSARLSPQVKS